MAYPLPLRVLVKGPSNVGWASPMANSRENMNFPRVAEAELLKGRPTLMRTISVPSERIKTALLRWEAEMIGDSPDVVVLAYGNYECIHFVLPWWLERHANSNTTRPRKLFRFYRRRILRPVWRTLANMQLWLDTHVDPLFFRSKLDAIVTDHEEMIKHIQKLHSPLVYVFQLVPPATRFAPWFPGMAARVDYVNEKIEALIKQIDRPNVRLFPMLSLVDEFCDGDIDVAMPDGFHFSTAMHRHIGEALARDIAVWADEQPHLAAPEAAASEDAAPVVATPVATAAAAGPRAPRKAAAKKAAAKKAAAKKVARKAAKKVVTKATARKAAGTDDAVGESVS